MEKTELFFIEYDKMLAGKIDKKKFTPYSKNDKIFIENNFYNLFKRKIFLKEFNTEYNGCLKNTIAYDKEGNIFIVLYKENLNENIFFEMNKIDKFLNENMPLFLKLLEDKTKKHIYTSNISFMIISSMFSKKDFTMAKNSNYKIEFFEWQTINNILILKNSFSNLKKEDKDEG